MKVIDLFCGAGGFTEGFKQAGLKVVLGLDVESKMLATYKENHPEVEVLEEDALKITPEDLPDADIIIGSPPCQALSKASTFRLELEEISLVSWMLGVIKEKQPRYWIGENVPPIRKYLPSWIPKVRILNAVNYGVPQRRKRCFWGNYIIPSITHSSVPQRTLDGKGLSSFLTARDAIGDLSPPSSTSNVWASQKAIEGEVHHHFYHKERGHGFCLNILDLNKPSTTITAHLAKGTLRGNQIIIQDEKWRWLTVEESALLQGFSSDYNFVGTDFWKYRQIGEAVPPPLAKALASAIKASGD